MSASRRDPRWSWYVRGYYAAGVLYPKRHGEMAVEVSGISREALALDIKVLTEREDIGDVLVGEWPNVIPIYRAREARAQRAAKHRGHL